MEQLFLSGSSQATFNTFLCIVLFCFVFLSLMHTVWDFFIIYLFFLVEFVFVPQQRQQKRRKLYANNDLKVKFKGGNKNLIYDNI